MWIFHLSPSVACFILYFFGLSLTSSSQFNKYERLSNSEFWMTMALVFNIAMNYFYPLGTPAILLVFGVSLACPYIQALHKNNRKLRTELRHVQKAKGEEEKQRRLETARYKSKIDSLSSLSLDPRLSTEHVRNKHELHTTKSELRNTKIQLYHTRETIKGKDELIKGKDEQVKDRDEQIKDRDEQIKDRDEQIKDKDDQIKDKDDQIKDKDDQIKDKDDQIKGLKEKGDAAELKEQQHTDRLQQVQDLQEKTKTLEEQKAELLRSSVPPETETSKKALAFTHFVSMAHKMVESGGEQARSAVAMFYEMASNHKVDTELLDINLGMFAWYLRWTRGAFDVPGVLMGGFQGTKAPVSDKNSNKLKFIKFTDDGSYICKVEDFKTLEEVDLSGLGTVSECAIIGGKRALAFMAPNASAGPSPKTSRSRSRSLSSSGSPKKKSTLSAESRAAINIFASRPPKKSPCPLKRAPESQDPDKERATTGLNGPTQKVTSCKKVKQI